MDPILIVIMWCSQHPSLVLLQQQKSHSPSMHPATQEKLEDTAHNYELEESDSIVFCLDYALNGIGSNSCGPALLEKYQFDDTSFQLEFTLVPFSKG